MVFWAWVLFELLFLYLTITRKNCCCLDLSCCVNLSIITILTLLVLLLTYPTLPYSFPFSPSPLYVPARRAGWRFWASFRFDFASRLISFFSLFFPVLFSTFLSLLSIHSLFFSLRGTGPSLSYKEIACGIEVGRGVVLVLVWVLGGLGSQAEVHYFSRDL